MNEIAKEMNTTLEKSSSIFFNMLSEFGKEIYMPKGIIVQSAEAKQLAKKYNATIGIAKENGEPMHLSSLNKFFNFLKPSEIYDYAPASGVQDLRTNWKKKIVKENPLIKSPDEISTPVVTNGLTNGIMLTGDLFVNPGDEIIIPDKLWENYNLIFEVRYKARITNYPLFDDKLTGFNTGALDEALKKSVKEKIILLFNFPNNPSGYTPTVDEVERITAIVKKHAESGKKILVVCDDAYYGLLYEKNLIQGSIFSRFSGLHKNIVSVKIDGFSKEDYAWGLRVGFITFADFDHKADTFKVLEQKTTACIRASISNCSLPSQSIFLNMMKSDGYADEKNKKFEILKKRALKTKEVAYADKYKDCWEVYPFNSGYFMCLKLKNADTEAVRMMALNKYQVGTIALGDDLRVAFSSVEIDEIEGLFDIIALCVRELRNK
jgi:aspartate/methionine/tyrosine aminotransferase